MTPSKLDLENHSSDKNANIELAYSYIQEFISDRKAEIRQIDLRLGTFLGFSGLLLRFAIDLPSTCPSYFLSKLGALIASGCAAGVAAWGLRSNPGGNFIEPYYLMEDECFNEENLRVKAMIVNTHSPGAKNLSDYAKHKYKILNLSILILIFGIVMFTINGILSSCFGICK